MCLLDGLIGVMTHREPGGIWRTQRENYHLHKASDDSERVNQTGGPTLAYRYTKTVPTVPGVVRREECGTRVVMATRGGGAQTY